MEKKAAFKWDDNNTETVVIAYQQQFKEDPAVANSRKFLGELARQVGAKSAQSVMAKLATTKDSNGEKVYQVVEGLRTGPAADKPARRTKGVIVRDIAAALGVAVETVDTLEKVKAEQLEALLKLITPETE